ncbi:rho GTPase-activating protein 22-like isoform X2 [Oculina patagonica]
MFYHCFCKREKKAEIVPEEKPALQISDHDILGWIEECVEFISQHGLETEGVFRVCGSVREINDIKQDFHRGVHPLKNASANDVHTVCGVLKRLLNELSEPLLPDGEQLARDLTRDQGVMNESDVHLQTYVSSLPEENRKCASSLIQLLHRISENSHVNGMTADNLGRVLTPTLFRPVTVYSLVLLPVLQNTLTRLTTLADSVFGSEKELCDEAFQSPPACETHVTRPEKMSIQAIRVNCHFKRFPVRSYL